MVYGAKRERFVPATADNQLNIFSEPESEEQTELESTTEEVSYTRKKKKKHRGRNAFPDHLPVEEQVIEPEEDTTGKKAGGEEGKFGDPDTDIPESKIPKVDGEMVDEIDVKNLGVNQALSSDVLGSGPLKNIFGNQDGFDAKMNVAMSGEGGDLVVGRGAGGMGFRGLGKGGGGEGFGRIGGLGKVERPAPPRVVGRAQPLQVSGQRAQVGGLGCS